MNLEESANFAEQIEAKSKKKKLLIFAIIACLLLIIFLIVMIGFIKYQDSITLKMFINNNQIEISKKLLKTEEEDTYINIKELSNLLGYTYTKGEYKKYNEDERCCYLSNNIEIVSIIADSSVITKYINYTEKPSIGKVTVSVKSNIGDSENYTLNKPIKIIDGSLYIEMKSIQDIFNVKLDLSETNRIKIYTIASLIPKAQSLASKLKFSELSGYYENMRALIDNMVVLGNGDSYGVYSMIDGSELISVKYKDIVYIQSSKEFLVTADTTIGILDSNGKTIVKPTEYDEISVLDIINKLYLVKKDNEYGVLDKNGNIIIYTEYDQIGLKNLEKFSSEINGNIIYDKCIPVKKDNKYGLYSVDGKELLPCSYESFGYSKQSTNKTEEQNTLLIPPSVGIKGIVLSYDKLYGIYDVNKNEIIIPCVCSKIYSITKSGETLYYVEYNGEQIELSNYLKENNLISEEIKNNTEIPESDDELEKTDLKEEQNFVE